MKFAPWLRHRLPADRCCNCDTRMQLEQLPLETPLAQGFAPDGPRQTLVVRAPFCPNCAPSARRRRPSGREQLALGFAAFIGGALLLANIARSMGSPLEPLLLLVMALLFGFGGVFGGIRAMKPERGQSSFWAPVRVVLDSGELRRGEVRTLVFHFTSKPYADAFTRLNAEPVGAGVIKVHVGV